MHLCVYNSVQFSCSVMPDCLRPHEPQHARPPCPSSTPGVYPNSCPLSRWWHPTISSSVVLFSSCPQSFPASVSFPVSQLFTSGGQSIGVSASTSVLPMKTQDWSPLGWTSWISLQYKGLSRVFSNTTVQKHQFFGPQLPFVFEYGVIEKKKSCCFIPLMVTVWMRVMNPKGYFCSRLVLGLMLPKNKPYHLKLQL